MMMLKNVFRTTGSFLFVLVMLTVTAVCAVSEESGIPNTCGENLTWSIREGVLTISGTGKMDDYRSADTPPWYDSRTAVSGIVIEEGATSVGHFAFDGFSSFWRSVCALLTASALFCMVFCRALT